MAQLVDQYGNPLKRQEVTRPYAGPTTGGVRPVISGHPAEGLTHVAFQPFIAQLLKVIRSPIWNLQRTSRSATFIISG